MTPNVAQPFRAGVPNAAAALGWRAARAAAGGPISLRYERPRAISKPAFAAIIALASIHLGAQKPAPAPQGRAWFEESAERAASASRTARAIATSSTCPRSWAAAPRSSTWTATAISICYLVQSGNLFAPGRQAGRQSPLPEPRRRHVRGRHRRQRRRRRRLRHGRRRRRLRQRRRRRPVRHQPRRQRAAAKRRPRAASPTSRRRPASPAAAGARARRSSTTTATATSTSSSRAT